MKYKIDFDRKDYLEFSEKFESGDMDDCLEELTEHSYDIESVGFELAYTRYYVAKLEQDIMPFFFFLAEIHDTDEYTGRCSNDCVACKALRLRKMMKDTSGQAGKEE